MPSASSVGRCVGAGPNARFGRYRAASRKSQRPTRDFQNQCQNAPVMSRRRCSRARARTPVPMPMVADQPSSPESAYGGNVPVASRIAHRAAVPSPPAEIRRTAHSYREGRVPYSNARSAGMGSPVSTISMAILGGRARGRRNSPPAAAASDRLTSGSPKAAALEATMRSQERAISQPPARAGPSTAAMMGFSRSRVAMPANPPRAVCRAAAWPEAMALRSAPALKTGPSPVTMPTQTSASPSSLSMAASMPEATSPLTALRASGRLMRSTATRPCCSYSTMAGR